MLVLQRFIDESIVIRVAGRRIEFQVSGIAAKARGRAVRLAFDAPDDVEINRLELDREKHPEDYPGGRSRPGATFRNP